MCWRSKAKLGQSHWLGDISYLAGRTENRDAGLTLPPTETYGRDKRGGAWCPAALTTKVVISCSEAGRPARALCHKAVGGSQQFGSTDVAPSGLDPRPMRTGGDPVVNPHPALESRAHERNAALAAAERSTRKPARNENILCPSA